MASKRSTSPAKKTTRTRKNKVIEPVVETPIATPIEPVLAVASEAIASVTEAEPVPVDEIRRRAYNYWVQGNPDPIANWFRAENDLKQH
jgi:hypothetical protein